MDSKLLLKSLADAGLLTQDALASVIRESSSLGKDAEGIILERHLVPEPELAKIKSRLLGVPYKAVEPGSVSDDALKRIPEETARGYKILPIGVEKNLLVVGMQNPDDTAAQEALRFIGKQQKISLGVYLITKSDLDAGLRRYAPFANEIQEAVKSLKLKSEAAGGRVIQLEEGGARVAEEAPVIKIVASFIKEAVNMKASDIHIEPQRARLRVRYRVDGKLQEATSLPLALHQPVVSRVKVLSELKIDETRIPQDGRFRAEIFGRDIDFRVSTFPTPTGEKVAIRVLDPSVGLKTLADLGLLALNEEKIRRAIAKPFGMVLITGPTGSGKTTTLYALLQILNNEAVNIVSLEDPVEYFVDGLNQSQVRPEIGYDFASGLRQILRQDPDVIMVGEIRDGETAALAVHAALTGHVVLSTLHTNSATSVIPRLIDMKVDAFLLPSALNLMVAQRLVPRLCQKCKTESAPSPEMHAAIKKELERLPPGAKGIFPTKESYKVFHSPGCPACNGKGVEGRVALFEILEMTKELAVITTSQVTEAKIAEEARRQGMLSMRQDGIVKALQGLVAMEEVLRETSEE
ncbi:MAG: Flp pilus assembly complex ATPase component TadA [Candidatus Harrisonbacteria bacterium]|nr:Flp pilus assembly complex ATPase component TadA [Candidatus Harrisonbacteria bacterium]